MILLQNPNIPVATNPVEIDAAIIDILSELNTNLSWLDNGYGRAYKNADARNGGILFFPEVYLGTQNNSQRYLNVTPDNDKGGSCFFFVSRETITEFQTGQYGFLNYQMAIIFSCNMELIQSNLLNTEYYQQNLIAEVRNVLSRQLLGKSYQLTLQSVEYLIENVFAEFDIQNTNEVEKAPFTHFRVNCSVVLPEQCPVPELPTLLGCKSMDLDGVNEYISYGLFPSPLPGNNAFNFQITDRFSISAWFKIGTQGFQTIVSKYDYSIFRGYGFEINSQIGGIKKLRFFISDVPSGGSIAVRSAQTMIPDVWYNVIVTYDGSGSYLGQNIYINSINDTTTEIAGSPTNIQVSNHPLEIGRLSQPSRYVDGLINNVRIWNTDLSAVDVATEYNGGVVNVTPVQSANLLLDTDIGNATYLTADPTYGTGYLINNKVDNSKLFGNNSEVEDLVDGCPE